MKTLRSWLAVPSTLLAILKELRTLNEMFDSVRTSNRDYNGTCHHRLRTGANAYDH